MHIISTSNLISVVYVVLKIYLSKTTYYMLILLSLGGVSDWVSVLVLQNQESNTMLDSNHSLFKENAVL